MYLTRRFNYALLVVCFVLINLNGIGQEVVSVKKFTQKEISHLNDEHNFSALKMVYTTTDHQGKPVNASGLVLIPENRNLNEVPVALFAHGTTTKRGYVPSALNFQADYASLLAVNGYITVVPDYLGLGDSPGLHPYLHSETEATACIDMIRAVRRYFKNNMNISIRKDIYLTGYSQGGHAVMATQKYIEENNLTGEFQIVASAPCSGPYSLSKVMYNYVRHLNEMNYCDPELIIHTIICNQYVYQDLYSQSGEYFIHPYDSIIDSYIERDCSFELNDHFPVQMSNFIKANIFDNWENNPDDPYIRSLRKSDVSDWKPETPVKMYYSTADIKVPYQNALEALSTMKQNGAKNIEAIEVSTTLDHNELMNPAMKLVIEWFNACESEIKPL